VAGVTLDEPASQGRREGRRERNKQRTRDALIEAAVELFADKGYEHTVVREITDAADVSERTFFRYFASKEDLVLSYLRDELRVFAAALAARPPREEPFTAIRNAYYDCVRRQAAFLSVMQLIEASPDLKAAQLRDFHEHGEEVLTVLAEREGVDPTDPRPQVLLGLFGALVFFSNRDWQAGRKPDADAIIASFDHFADHVMPALFGHWR
jgi:AcrR family transcriptional regulator